MIGQATGHRRGTSHSPVLGFTRFLMSKTEIVGAANEIHPGVQSRHARSRMPTLPCQARQSLPDGSIQAFNKSGIEHGSPTRELEQLLCLLQLTVSHLAGDLHNPLFSMRLIIIPMYRCGHTSKDARPTPASFLTFSRKARRMLPG